MIKNLLIIIALLSSLNLKAQQSFGFGIGMAATNSMLLDIKYYINKNAFSIGYTYEFNDSNGKLIENQLPNHGRSISGTGEFFSSVDVGYSRSLFEKLYLSAELSIGSNKSYTNYIDRRFTSGGYHMINNSEETLGYGGKVTYFITPIIGIYSGYNTIRQASIGVDFRF